MYIMIICGAPGSGKGTQSDIIAEKYNLLHLSTGDMLREEIASGSGLGKTIDSYISKGNLIPDELMEDLLAHRIDTLPGQIEGIILDGFPRTVKQAEALESILGDRNLRVDALVDLDVRHDELIIRLLNRGKTSGRSDDNISTITQRLHVYAEKTVPVNQYYIQRGMYHRVDGMGTKQEIFERISSVIDQSREE